MNFETERLWLRDFEEKDWEAMFAYQIKPQYYRYYNWTQRTEEEVRQSVQDIIGHQKATPRLKFQLALIVKDANRLIGSCSLWINDSARREASISYELDPQEWGKGYATEASQLVVRFGFENLGLHRIWSQVIAENLRSGRVLVRLGMRLEGRLRETEYIRDRWCDTLLYAILDHEWQAL